MNEKTANRTNFKLTSKRRMPVTSRAHVRLVTQQNQATGNWITQLETGRLLEIMGTHANFSDALAFHFKQSRKMFLNVHTETEN